VALARVALQENRKVAAVHFSTTTHVQRVESQADLMSMAMTFISGGTAVAPALHVAVQQVDALAREGFPGGDVVFISDGESDDDETTEVDGEDVSLDELCKRMAAAGVRLWSVAIGQQWRSTYPLRVHAERYVFAHDRDLQVRNRAVELATDLSGAAKATVLN